MVMIRYFELKLIESRGQKMESVWFWLVLAFLMTHELDAVYRHEWRLLVVLRRMRDDVGRTWFIWLHVPLFWLLMWLPTHPVVSVQFWAMVVIDLFTIVHVYLHWRLRHHTLYEFEGWVSNGLIWGGGVAAVVHLILMLG